MTKLLPGLPPPFEFVRDYPAPEPSSVDSLDGFLAWCDRIACADQDRFGAARTMWVFMVEGGHCLGILHTPFFDQRFKNIAFELVASVLAEEQRILPVISYGFINEAWMARRKAGEPEGVLPSEDPNRIDALIVNVHHRDGGVRGRSYKVTYDAQRKPSRSLYAEIGPEDFMGGRATDLFPRGKPN